MTDKIKYILEIEKTNERYCTDCILLEHNIHIGIHCGITNSDICNDYLTPPNCPLVKAECISYNGQRLSFQEWSTK